MTLEQVKKALNDIDAVENDPEKAHVYEDELLWAFVKACAEGTIHADTIPIVAHALVEWDTKNRERTRWYA